MTNNCIVCNKTPCDIDHIKTRGSGGGEEGFNKWSLCRLCHIEKHQIGIFSFANKYPKAKDMLLKLGWVFENQSGVMKLRRK